MWTPEAIATERGFSAVYPAGRWTGSGRELTQHVAAAESCAGGDFPRVDEHLFEYAGIAIPVESPVSWDATVTAEEDVVRFSIRLTNVGDRPLRRAGAAICLNFSGAAWWSADRTFVRSGGRVVPLGDLARDGGRANEFQAFLVGSESCDNPFYRDFWGFSSRRLDEPVMVSENAEAGVCVAIRCDRAYFMLNNLGNPCTDMMVAFGDVAPGASAEAGGTVTIGRGEARDMLRTRI